jgi:hypothetical protein
MTVDPNKIAKMITEDPDEINPLDDEYSDLEDADEFEYDKDKTQCSNCEEWYTVAWRGETLLYTDLNLRCENCGSTYCENCMSTPEDIGGPGYPSLTTEPPFRIYHDRRQTLSNRGHYWCKRILTCPRCPNLPTRGDKSWQPGDIPPRPTQLESSDEYANLEDADEFEENDYDNCLNTLYIIQVKPDSDSSIFRDGRWVQVDFWEIPEDRLPGHQYVGDVPQEIIMVGGAGEIVLHIVVECAGPPGSTLHNKEWGEERMGWPSLDFKSFSGNLHIFYERGHGWLATAVRTGWKWDGPEVGEKFVEAVLCIPQMCGHFDNKGKWECENYTESLNRKAGSLLSEDPDEVNPLDNIEDEYIIDRPHGEHPVWGPCDCDECQAWDAVQDLGGYAQERIALARWRAEEYNEMAVDPNKIAKMITEDPDEVNPLDDEYADLEDADEFDDHYGDSRPCNKCGTPVFEGGLTRESGVGQYCEFCDTMWCGDCAKDAVVQTRLSFDDHYGNGVHTECPNCAKAKGLPSRTASRRSHSWVNRPDFWEPEDLDRIRRPTPYESD